jgi:hypothetical protein
MEDIVPLIFFLIIVIVNGLKYLMEKGLRKRSGERPEEPAAPRQEPRSIEDFFEQLTEQVAPKPAPVPDWPKGYERPDYVQEMEDFERAQAEEWAIAEEEKPEDLVPVPAVEDEIEVPRMKEVGVSRQAQATNILAQSPLKTTSSLVFSSREVRIRGTSPFGRVGLPGRTTFSIKGRKNLKQAIIANAVLGPPRAFDRSFDNTVAK